MKKFFVLFAATAACTLAVSCGEKVEGSQQVKDLLPKRGQLDTASYLLGVNFGLVITQNDFGKLNMSEVYKGMDDALKAKEGHPMDSVFVRQFKIDPSKMNGVLNEFLQKRMAYKSALNKEKGDAFRLDFLAKNQADSTESGIVYLIQEAGSDVRATSDKDTVKVSYRGTLIDGTEFDKNDSISFSLNRVIKGWTEGMKLVGEQGKITLVIPANLAYGEHGPRNIGNNATLVFDVDLHEVHPFVEKKVEATPAKKRK